MNKLVLVFLGSLIFILPACKQKSGTPLCPPQYKQQLLSEVENQFNHLLGLVEKESVIDFKTFLSDSLTAMTEGFWIPKKHAEDYTYGLFQLLVHDSTEITKTEFHFVSCGNAHVYQRILAVYSDVDTARGCQDPIMVPFKLRITTEPASSFNDYDSGIETMQIRPVDTSGNNVRMMSQPVDTSGNNIKLMRPVRRKIPIKTIAVSILWTNGDGVWKNEHVHVSLGLKRTGTYFMEQE